MNHLKDDKPVYEAIQEELNRQRNKLEMIASENIVSYAVMEAQGSVLTNKYAEGYPGKRYYGGCEFVDKVEQLAIDRAKELFGAEHVNVQPHSGSQANFAVYYGLLKPGDTMMGMNLTDGGHLSHGSPVNISGNYFNVVPYGVRKDDELLGMTVTVHASIIAITDRDVTLSIKAWDEQGEIGHGLLKRSIVLKKTVLEKAEERTRLLLIRQANEQVRNMNI